jgi:uncharacterized repeat protein (TIGR04076 family)
MVAIKITVLKRTLHADLVKAYSGREQHPCEVLKEGQVFIAGFQKPEGFCDWAWTDISRQVLALYTGGDFNTGPFKNWMKESGKAIACCTDGYRPVTFMLERIDTKSLIDISGLEKPAPAGVYDSERWGEFSYRFPALQAGSPYRVRLHLCEVYHGTAGKRYFNVDVNGRRVLEEFDVLKEAGGKGKGIIKEFDAVADKDGLIRIDFKKGSADYPKLSGIEVVSGGKTVYAVNSGGGENGAFKADAYFEGGNAVGD